MVQKFRVGIIIDSGQNQKVKCGNGIMLGQDLCRICIVIGQTVVGICLGFTSPLFANMIRIHKSSLKIKYQTLLKSQIQVVSRISMHQLGVLNHSQYQLKLCREPFEFLEQTMRKSECGVGEGGGLRLHFLTTMYCAELRSFRRG